MHGAVSRTDETHIRQEEAAKHYVPPAAQAEKPIKAPASAASTPGIPLSANQAAQPQANTVKFDASLPYIDPRTGLPSPTQPTIKIHEDVVEAKSISGPAPTTAKTPQNGKPSSTAPNKKNPAPIAVDSSRKKSARTPTSAEPYTSASSSINAKYPTGSAGDPIEIDDLDIDMDNDADIVPLIRPPTNTGKEQSGNKATQRGTTGAGMAIQPEGIGLGLGIGEINVDLPAGSLAAPDSLLNPPTEDVAGDVSALLANIQNAVAATAGEAQLSEEDIMKFFETLAPGTGDGGDAGQAGGAGLLAGNDGQFAAGLGMADQFAGTVQDPSAGLGQPFINPTGDLGAEATNALGAFSAGEAAAAPVEAAENAMPEDLDLSNMDWTQYSALLADIPDENGA
jgi:hypothetical protein